MCTAFSIGTAGADATGQRGGRAPFGARLVIMSSATRRHWLRNDYLRRTGVRERGAMSITSASLHHRSKTGRFGPSSIVKWDISGVKRLSQFIATREQRISAYSGLLEVQSDFCIPARYVLQGRSGADCLFFVSRSAASSSRVHGLSRSKHWAARP